MRVEMTWKDVPVEVKIINTPSNYNFVDPVDISGFNKLSIRSRYSSFTTTQDVVDVVGVFDIDVRNGIGNMQSTVDSIEIPALDIELSVTKTENREYEDSEENIQTSAKELDASDFEGQERYGDAPYLNVTTIRIVIDYETKEVALEEYDGIEWGRYDD